MTFDNLDVERDDAVAFATINRPKVLNALERHTFGELRRGTPGSCDGQARKVTLAASRDARTS